MSELEPQQTPIIDTPPIVEPPMVEPPTVVPPIVEPPAAQAVPPAPDPAPADAPPPAAPPDKPAPKPQEQRAAKPNDRGPKPDRRERQAAPAASGPSAGGPKPDRGPGPERGRGPDRGPGAGSDRGADRRGPRGPERGPDRGPDRGRGPEPPSEIDLDKLVNDSLYLDNQAHAVVARLRDMDSGTRSQLRRFFSAVRRACRAPEGDRQHQFVMLRARLAYTIARHQLRSLDPLERLLLQVTRKNDTKGYERFRDLFEAIVAYNE